MREYLSAVVGNEALRTRLGNEIARGAVSHAYILEGDAGSGKHTLARAMAMALACENRAQSHLPLPCAECPTCRKIAAGNCPDLITVSRLDGKATMGVDVVRILRDSVSTLPNDLDFKIYVIEDAHTLTTQAQNALLLTLEEPPPFVLFLLLAERADMLLETIRSRAPVLRMQPVPEQQIGSYLLDNMPVAEAIKQADGTEFSTLLRMANGRIGRAIELLEEKQRAPMLARRADAIRVCELLADGTQQCELLTLLLSFGKMREEITARLVLLQEALRDLLLLLHTENAPLIFFTDRDKALDLAEAFTAATLLSFVRATDDALEALAANANTRLTLTQYHCRLTA